MFGIIQGGLGMPNKMLWMRGLLTLDAPSTRCAKNFPPPIGFCASASSARFRVDFAQAIEACEQKEPKCGQVEDSTSSAF